jgi:hypothetical protein
MRARFSPRSRLWRGGARAIAALLVGLALVATARAQRDIQASASLSETQVIVGEPVEYRIEVRGTPTASRPSEFSVDGLNLTDIQSGVEIRMENGGMNAVATYRYIFETTRAGTFTIPAQQFAAGGTTVRTNPVTLTVVAAGDTRGKPTEKLFFAELIIPKNTPYVGESIPVELRLYFSPRVRVDPSMNPPVVKGEGFTVQKVTDPQMDTLSVGGQDYQAIIFKTSITPLKTGPLTVGPTVTDTRVVLPRVRPRSFSNGPFNDPFFNEPFGGIGLQRNVELTSDPVVLEVRPLPPGAPASFTGAIGNFTLESDAEPKQVNAGDPVTARLMIRGRGNFDRINPPAPVDISGWRTYPASGKFRPDDDVKLSGTKTFEQVFVPIGNKNTLPLYEFSYLDPGTGKYRTLNSEPIIIAVDGVAAPTPVAPVASEPPGAGATATSPPSVPAKDILHIRVDSPGGGSFVPLYRRPAFWLPQAIAMVVVLAALGGYLWRSRPGRAVAERAMTERQRRDALAARLHDRATTRREFYFSAAEIAQTRAADRSGRAPLTLGGEEVIALCEVEAPAADTIREIFRVRDEIIFAGGEDSAPVSDEERSAALDALAKLATGPGLVAKS